eukprot:CAMPEP_0174385452 /NCGR_PEP_ID=MMETSP0811_2-20130205/126608_1 /TAXON_ID=73025 ORGANISM="Eutreptiella gymnastica-like, Strain CCMP1594" /NCGR_SAMPLE_ID=MMETSP0811_2 /ASSEMBLY_ACC=CAM_ASM_000667 /LENGTH=77 /DNA_ID=CAMNT_0015539771 /DNA_START=170 /DNA_END=403 /DNA_ORIENTATION=+
MAMQRTTWAKSNPPQQGKKNTPLQPNHKQSVDRPATAGPPAVNHSMSQRTHQPRWPFKDSPERLMALWSGGDKLTGD